MNKIKVISYIIILSTLAGSVYMNNRYRKKLNISQQNNHALLDGIRELETKNNQKGVEVNALQLSLSQYKQYRKEQSDSLKQMGVKLKNLEMVARHYMEINAELSGSAKDTVITVIKDSVLIPQPVKYINVSDRHITLKGIADDTKFTGTIYLPVNISQTVEAHYKYRFLWWRWGLKGFKQKILSDNPYVKIKYSEIIKVK